jgi:methionyl aminopeptidase
MNNNHIDIYKSLAVIHNEIEDCILKEIRVGLRVFDLCIFIENSIRERTVDIAFPVGININDCIAHYSPLDSDSPIVLCKDDVVKIDYGIHKDGYILDAAFTVCFRECYRELLETSRKACVEAAKMFFENTKISNISKRITSLIDCNRYSIVKELCGHQIKPYRIHDGNVIPNILLDNYKGIIHRNEVYTVEPYISTSKNSNIYYDTSSSDNCSHYMFNYHEKDFNNYSKLIALIPDLYQYNTLAFNKRWLSPKSLEYLDTFVKKGIYKEYPGIFDKDPNAKVAQFETTILVTDSEPIILKNFHNVDKYIILN